MRNLRDVTVFSVLLVSVFTASVAHSRETAPVPNEPRAPLASSLERRRWYGWQTLVLDTASMTLLGTAWATNGGNAPLSVGGIALYAVGGPIVHGAHGSAKKAFADFGIRAATPIVFGAIGWGIGRATFNGCREGEWLCSPAWSGAAGALVGGFVGAVAAIVVDAAWIAYEPEGARSAAPVAARWSPLLAITPRGDAAFGIGGSF